MLKTRGVGMRVIGYHGTSDGAARRILSSGFEISRNEYDWLGDGACFFQDAPLRAWEWARQRFGDDAAVVGAEIDLADRIDLLDVEWDEVLRESYADLLVRLQATANPIPRQTSGAHRLDRAVVNHAAGLLESLGVPVRTVRATFREGEPVFPGSALWSRSHVQIAVRDPAAINRLWQVSAE